MVSSIVIYSLLHFLLLFYISIHDIPSHFINLFLIMVIGTVFAYGQTGSGKTFTIQGTLMAFLHSPQLT